MTDAGFFRGTSADQDNRFANKQKKLLKELNFSPILNTKLNMSKIDIDSLKPWIEKKINDVLEKDDELLSESIYEHLAGKDPDGKGLLMLITGFVDDGKASKFMEELWAKLIDLQENSNGVSKSVNENDPDSELKSNDNHGNEMTKPDNLDESNHNSNDGQPDVDPTEDGRRSSKSSHSLTPPSRSISKSPGNHKLDERSRGRPRKRMQDDTSRDGSNPPMQDKKQTRSPSRSSSRSRSAGVSRRSPGKAESGSGLRRRSRSSSHSKRSISGSRSPYSRSRSSSRSPRHRSRSPHSHSHRGRRSRSRDRGYRPRSRSPRGRRGYGGSRGSYRGPYGFNDRRRGMSHVRRRPSPWSSSRRRFSPRSPVSRRRRTPSFSPRRRRSPSPYNRRLSRSRSPPGHMLSRSIPSPRPHNASGGGHLDMIAGRHMPHHDMHRQILPLARSPRGPVDHRGFGEGQLLPRHSPGPIMNKLPELPPSHSLISSQPGPSGSRLHSPPSSGRKKHKKDKKHRKHKKSKKRSASPEKKKHKKHKKTKKHKSH